MRGIGLFLILGAKTCYADPSFTVLQEKELPQQLGVYRLIEFSAPQKIYLYALMLNKQYRVRAYNQPVENQYYAKFLDQINFSENFVIGVNGGYYSPDFHPVGLFVDKNVIIHPKNPSKILNVCVKINQLQKLMIETYSSDCFNSYSAFQAGPLLLKEGKAISLIPYQRQKNKLFFSEQRRTILAITQEGNVLILITSPVSLEKISQLLLANPHLFLSQKIQTAANLDGGSSTTLFIRFSEFPFYFHELKPVKTFLFFNGPIPREKKNLSLFSYTDYLTKISPKSMAGFPFYPRNSIYSFTGIMNTLPIINFLPIQ